MAQRKRKAVFSAEPEQLAAVKALVREGQYRSPSEFVREAITEKLERIRRTRLERQVDQYCSLGLDREDLDLIASQAFPDDDE